jgi:hypothetical protein
MPCDFAQSSTNMYINRKGKIEGSTFVSILQLGVHRGESIGGKPNVPKKWPINMAPLKKFKKRCEHTHDLINALALEVNMRGEWSDYRNVSHIIQSCLFICKHKFDITPKMKPMANPLRASPRVCDSRQ